MTMKNTTTTTTTTAITITTDGTVDCDTRYDALSSASQHPAQAPQLCRSWGASLIVAALDRRRQPRRERAPYLGPRKCNSIPRVLTSLLPLLLLAPSLSAASIHTAAKKGDIDGVRKTVATDPDSLNDRDWFGRTALHHAVREGHSELVRALLTMGADSAIKDRGGRVAADFAKPGDTATATVLKAAAPAPKVEEKPAPQTVPKQGKSPLHQAIARNRTLLAQELIEAGAKVEPELLPMVLRYRNLDTAKLLLTHGADPDSKDRRGRPLLLEALRGRQPEIAELLIAHGANLNATVEDDLSLVDWAIRNGHQESAELLVRHGAKPAQPHPAQLANAIARKPADARALSWLEAHPDWAKASQRGQPLLIAAISQRRFDVASKMISLGADPNASASFGRSALHAAAEVGNPELIAELLAAGAKADARDHRGRSARDLSRLSVEASAALVAGGVPRFTALHDAIAKSDLEAAKAAFAEFAGLETTAADGRTPLMAARRSAKISQWLIQQGAKLDAVDSGGRDALHHAVIDDQPDTVAILLKAGSDPNHAATSGLRPIHFAKSAAVVKQLAARDADLKTAAGPFKRTPMAEAVRHRREAVVEALLDAGAEFADNEAGEALLKAAERGDIPGMDALLQRGVKIDATDRAGRTALHHVSAAHSEPPIAVIEFLLKQGADVNTADKASQTPAHAAAGRHRAAQLKTLAAAGADLQARDRVQQTPLHHAANSHRPDAKMVAVMKQLMAQGAPPNPRDLHGRTPLDIVESRLHRSGDQNGVVDALRALGARRGTLFPKRLNPPLHLAIATGDQARTAEILAKDPAAAHSKDDQGRSPLHLAAAQGNAESATELLVLGVDADIPDEFGRTPLHAAARMGHVVLVRMLLAKGAKADTQDLGGFRAADLAKQRQHTDILDLLK
jgi:ankyrin repeat protein